MSKRQTVKRISVAALAVVFVALSVLSLVGCTTDREEGVALSIGTTEKHRAAMTLLVDRFNAQNDDIKVSLHVYNTETEKNYYLSHGEDDCDLYTFDEAMTANAYSSRLTVLDRNSCTNRYLVSIINGLRAANGSLYVLPADGFYYTQCYNTDLLDARGMNLPSTMSELKLLAARLKNTLGDSSSACATIGGNNSVLFALMSVAYPLFLNTVEGAYALTKLAYGEVDLLDADYRASWKDVFENLQVLYDEKFYSLDDLDKTHDDGITRFNGGNAYGMQNSANTDAETEIASGINVAYTPFVGTESRDACFGSMPSFYLSVAASSAQNTAVGRFLDYFATADAQKQTHKNFDDNRYISYLKNSSTDLPEIYGDLQGLVNDGRLFVVDAFYYIFGDCVDELVRFLGNDVNIDTMMYNLSEQINANRNADASSVVTVNETLSFDKATAYTQETPLGRFYAEALTNGDYVDGVVVPSKLLSTSLLRGTLTEKELYCVFADTELAFARMTAKDLLAVYAAIAEDCFPLTAKLTVRDGKVYDSAGRALDDNATLYVLVPQNVLSGIGSHVEVGKTISSNEKLLSYFNSVRSVLR